MKKFFVFISLFFINFLIVSADDKVDVKFSSCIDGDTAKFVIDGNIKTVRFLSINTPEIDHSGNNSEAFGEEASKYTCEALTNASIIELQYDPKSDKTDKYDRILAWVFIDGKLLQEMLICEGLAEVKYVYDDYLYSTELQLLEEEAKNNNVGMWNDGDIFINNYQVFIYVGVVIIIIVIALCNKKVSKKYKINHNIS